MTRIRVLVLLLLAGGGVSFLSEAHAISCDALVGKRAWFIGGEVTVNPDGTFVQQSGKVLPAAPMSCGTFPGQLESLFDTEFGPIKAAAEINNTIFHAGEGARGIVSAEGPGGGHYFNIVRFVGDVLLLDGQLGRQVSWAEYRRMGLQNFQLVRTN